MRGVLRRQPAPALQLGLGYNDAKFDELPNSVDDEGELQDLAGMQLPLAPEWSYNASVQYRVQLLQAS